MLGFLNTILGPALAARHGITAVVVRPFAARLHAFAVARAANDAIPNAWEIFAAAAADQYVFVLLQLMTFTRYKAGDPRAIVESDTTEVTVRRVGLLGIHDPRLLNNPGREGLPLQGTRLGLSTLWYALFAYQLVNRGHPYSLGVGVVER